MAEKPGGTMGKRNLILPTTIRIGFHDYGVEYVEGMEIDGNEVMGCILFDAKLLKISTMYCGRKLPASSILQSLMHEITHAIDHETEFEVFNDKEPAVDSFASYMCMVMRDNPDLLRLFR
jgi:hypothetical protein